MPIRRPTWFWAGYLRIVLLVRYFARFFFSEVQRLAVVHTMHWLLVPPIARDRTSGRPEDRGAHLLFESNFSGDGADYIESFARSVKDGMGLIFKPALGYPGIEDPAGFTTYAFGLNIAPSTYYCAYPAASPTTVQRALTQMRTTRNDTARTAAEFNSPLPLPLRLHGKLASPLWATIVMPIRHDRVAVLRRHLDDCPQGTSGFPFDGLSTIHFARLTVIDLPSGSVLMLTLNFDALQRYRRESSPRGGARGVRLATRIAVHELVIENLAALRHILDHCENSIVLDTRSASAHQATVDYLLGHQVDRGRGRTLAYACAPKATVADIRRALLWEEQQRDPA